jgi:hypothetical protein
MRVGYVAHMCPQAVYGYCRRNRFPAFLHLEGWQGVAATGRLARATTSVRGPVRATEVRLAPSGPSGTMCPPRTWMGVGSVKPACTRPHPSANKMLCPHFVTSNGQIYAAKSYNWHSLRHKHICCER